MHHKRAMTMRANRARRAGIGIRCGFVVTFILAGLVSFSRPAHASPALADTSTGIHLALPFNYNESTVNNVRQAEVGVVDYVFGASNSGAQPNNIPGGSAAHDYYIPFPQLEESTAYNTAWFQANHPDWLMYKNDRTTLAYWGQEYINTQTPTLDYTNPAVQQFIMNTFLTPAMNAGFQGIAWDHGAAYNDNGSAGHYDAAGQWVQQYTGNANDSAYAAAMSAALQSIGQKIKTTQAGMEMTVNQSADCSLDPALYKSGVGPADIVFDEQGVTNGGNASYPYLPAWDAAYCPNKWLYKMQTLDNLQTTQGKAVVLNNQEPYTVTAGMTDTNSQARFDLQWALANYLLIKHNRTYFAWEGEQQYGTGPLTQREYSAPIGGPTDTFYAKQGVYMRDYSNGLAVVNPSTNAAVTITLPAGRYQDLYGGAVGGSISMPAHSGMVVLASATSPATSTPTTVPISTVAPTSTPTSVPTSTPTSVPTNTPTFVPTNTPTSIPTSTPTSVPTSTAIPMATPAFSSAQVVLNSGFESGSMYWQTASRGGTAMVTSTLPYSGHSSAQFCGYTNCNDELWQSVTIPATSTAVSLDFQAFVEAKTTSCRDRLTVQIRSSSGSPIATTHTICNGSSSNSWVHQTADLSSMLSSYRGQTVQIAFQGLTAWSHPSRFFVDDVQLTVHS
ncbi:MAG: hypothetical protein NVS2B16_10860 [Chloroflexota bacterium]